MLTLPEMLMILHSWDAFHIILKLPFRQKHNFTLVQTNHASIALKERGGYKTYIIQKPNHIFLLCQHPQQEHQPHSTMEDTDSITTQINRFNKYSKIDGGCRRGTNLNRRHHVHVYWLSWLLRWVPWWLSPCVWFLIVIVIVVVVVVSAMFVVVAHHDASSMCEIWRWRVFLHAGCNCFFIKTMTWGGVGGVVTYIGLGGVGGTTQHKGEREVRGEGWRHREV